MLSIASEMRIALSSILPDSHCARASLCWAGNFFAEPHVRKFCRPTQRRCILSFLLLFPLKNTSLGAIAALKVKQTVEASRRIVMSIGMPNELSRSFSSLSRTKRAAIFFYHNLTRHIPRFIVVFLFRDFFSRLTRCVSSSVSTFRTSFKTRHFFSSFQKQISPVRARLRVARFRLGCAIQLIRIN